MKTYIKPITSVALTNLSECIADVGEYYSGQGGDQLSKPMNGRKLWESEDDGTEFFEDENTGFGW